MIKKFLKDRIGTVILFAIIIIFVIWGVISINIAKNNAITYSEDYEAPEGNVIEGETGKYKTIATSGSLELLYNEVKGTVQIKDTTNDYLWKGVCDNEVYDLDSINKQWAYYLQSPITVTYSDLKKRDAAPNTLYEAKDCSWLESEYIDNGVAVTYGFLKQGLYVTVEYTVEDGDFVVRIPYEKIREESRYAIITVEVLPYLGAAGNDVDGYLLYPDGSGAITTYANASERNANVKSAMWYTYSNRFTSVSNLTTDDTYDRYTAALPILGIKNDDNAILGAVTEGAENTGIVAYPSGYVIDLNHIGFEVYIRNVFNVNLYSMSTGTDSTATGGTIQRVDKEITPVNREIRYFMLSGEDANYSGMAKAYREYLIENNMLEASENKDNGLELGLELLMGATKDGMVFDEQITMTTFEQATQILNELKDEGIANVETIVDNWTSGSSDYNLWGPRLSLGGKSGLKTLNNYAGENEGVSIYLDNEFMIATDSTSGISEDDDVAYDGLNVELSLEDTNGTIYYLLNPNAIYARNNKLLKKLKSFANLGVAYIDLAKYAYADYNEKNSFNKTQMVEKLVETLEATKDSGRKIATNKANQYVYQDTDFIYGLREDEYGLAITDEGVPFVELVFSGMIPYCTNNAGNLAYDLEYQKLKWIEYGAMPYFNLTYESAENLRESDYDSLFSSTWSDWKDTVVSVYKEFETNLGDLYGTEMTSHEFLADDVVCVTYENGSKVYINYNEESTSVNGITIEAKSYKVVKGGTN